MASIILPTRVPTETQQVAPRPPQRADSSPLAYGTGGSGLAALGQGLRDVAAMAGQIQDRDDIAAAKQADNDFQSAMNDRLWNADTGYYALKGRAAYDSLPTVRAGLESLAEEQAKGLTGRQAELFTEAAKARINSATPEMSSFAMRQRGAWLDGVDDSTIDTNINAASIRYTDDAARQTAYNAAMNAISNKGTRAGWSPEAIADQRAAVTDKFHAAIVTRAAQDNPAFASDYLKAHGAEMSPQTYATLGRSTKEGALKARIGTAVTDIMSNPVAPAAISGDMAKDIAAEATSQGVDPVHALAVARLESNAGRAADTPGSQYQGVFQLGSDEWKRYAGSADRGDKGAQVAAGVAAVNAAQGGLSEKLGRDAAPWEGYLAHQQGVAGAAALLSADPAAKASDVLAPFYKNGQNIAAITGNGGTPDMTAGQFREMWQQRYQRAAGQVAPLVNQDGQQDGANGGGTGTPSIPASYYSPAAAGPDWTAINQRINAIPDVDVREGVRREVAAQMEMQTRIQKQQQDQVEARAWTAIEQGASPNALPLDYRLALGREGMEHLYSYAETKAKGAQPQTDWELYDGLRTMRQDDPQEFLKLSPLAIRSHLDDGAFKEFEGWRDDAMKGQQQAGQGIATLDKQISDLFNSLGWTGENRAPDRGRMARQIQTAVSAAQQAKGKPLTFDERQQIVDRAGIQVGYRGIFGRSTTAPVTDIKTVNDIPADAVAQIRQRNPWVKTDQEVVDFYTQLALSGYLEKYAAGDPAGAAIWAMISRSSSSTPVSTAPQQGTSSSIAESDEQEQTDIAAAKRAGLSLEQYRRNREQAKASR